MLNTIHIQGFKGFKDTRIEPIRKVNLILGGQNVGKTSLLEAVYLGASEVGAFQSLPGVFRAAEGRDIERYVSAVWGKKKCAVELGDGVSIRVRVGINDSTAPKGFFDLDETKSNEMVARRWVAGDHVGEDKIAAARKNGVALTPAHLRVMKGVLTPARAVEGVGFCSPLAVSLHLPPQLDVVQLFDRMVISRKKRQLLDMLRRIEPRLEDMHSLSPDGEQRIYVELAGESNALPLPLLGHGFSRLVHLYCSLLVTDAKLALVDEIENGIHYSSLPILFQGIQDIAAHHGVQTMMTTHSWECIVAAYNVFAEAGCLQDFQLIRLERDGDNVRAVVINDEQLDVAMEAAYEIR